MFFSVLLPSLPTLFRIPRPHTCIGSESRLSLREGFTAQAAMTSLCYDSCEFHWNKRRLRHVHVKNTIFTKTLCSQYCGKTRQTCRNACIWSSGEWNGWPVSRHKPLDTTILYLLQLYLVTRLLISGNLSTSLEQCFSTFVRPRPGKFLFHKTMARSQQIYS